MPIEFKNYYNVAYNYSEITVYNKYYLNIRKYLQLIFYRLFTVNIKLIPCKFKKIINRNMLKSHLKEQCHRLRNFSAHSEI